MRWDEKNMGARELCIFGRGLSDMCVAVMVIFTSMFVSHPVSVRGRACMRLF